MVEAKSGGCIHLAQGEVMLTALFTPEKGIFPITTTQPGSKVTKVIKMPNNDQGGSWDCDKNAIYVDYTNPGESTKRAYKRISTSSNWGVELSVTKLGDPSKYVYFVKEITN